MQMMPPNFSYGGIGNTFNASRNSFVSNMSLSSLSANQSASNSSFLRRDDKLKSVPPRFIFPSMRPEGKVGVVRVVYVCACACTVSGVYELLTVLRVYM